METVISEKRVNEIHDIYKLLKAMNDLLAIENKRGTKTAFYIQNAMFYAEDAYHIAQKESDINTTTSQ